MPPSSPALSLRRAARLGDRARRSQLAWRLIATVAPWAAAGACAAAVLSAIFGGPRFLGLGLLALIATTAAMLLLIAGRDRATTDVIVAELDQAAALNGALRSAHWFAAEPHPTSRDTTEAAWLAFHLDTATSRAEGVEWAAVFPTPPARRRWLMTLACAVATAGPLAWPTPLRPHLSTNPVAQPVARASTPIPVTLAPALVQGIRAMENGRQPSRDALSAVGEALDLARRDPEAKRQLDQVLAHRSNDAWGSGVWSDFGNDPQYHRAEDDLFWQAGTGALEWAYREAASRASVEQQAAAAQAQPPQAASAQTGDPGGAGETTAGQPDSGAPDQATPDGTPAQADVRGDPGRFTSLLFGNQRASDDGTSPPPPRQAAGRAALAAALRREVVHAPDDVAGEHREERGTRRTSTAGGSAPSGVETPHGVRYDRTRATRPPAVPDARQAIVHDVFVRRPERGGVPKQP